MANLPYNVSVPVLLHLLATFDRWTRGLVMVQAEVADRLAAPPGLEDLRHAVGEDGLVRRRGPGRQRCRPRCSGPCRTSSPGWCSIDARPAPATTATREQVFAVVDAAFAQRRKMLRSALSGLVGSSAAASDALLAAAGVDPQVRGEMLDVAAVRPDRRAARASATRPGRSVGSSLARRGLAPPAGTGRRTRPGTGQDQPRAEGRAAARRDGYHPLATVYQAVSLFDEVTRPWADPDGSRSR